MAVGTTHGKQLADSIDERFDLRLPLRVRDVRGDDIGKLEWWGSMIHWREINRRTYSDHLAGTRLWLVADVRGFPIGQVVIDVASHDYAYLYALRVHEPFQGLGVGTQLIGVGEQAARAHGFRLLQLAVEKTNTRARALYERLGFEIYTQRVDVWSYVDHMSQTHWVHEDVWGMRKGL